jgi:hypothetical protein
MPARRVTTPIVCVRRVALNGGCARDLWRIAVEFEDVVDRRGAEALSRVGLEAPRPSGADWSAFQRGGRATRG